jgi:hypothetical protein
VHLARADLEIEAVEGAGRAEGLDESGDGDGDVTAATLHSLHELVKLLRL